MSTRLYQADCVDVMSAMAACADYADAIVTDPPYGIGAWDWVHNTRELAAWHERWARQALAVLKPGGHMLMFAGTRTYHRMAAAVEDAGFEVRDQIVWLYGGGMPKTSPNADGFAPSLKPAHEPVGVFRKPFKGSARDCYAQHGTAMLNVDGCRLPTAESLNGGAYAQRAQQRAGLLAQFGGQNAMRNGQAGQYEQPSGRFPANVALDEQAAAALDAQSGHLKPGGSVAPGRYKPQNVGYGEQPVRSAWNGHGDAGGASRFFYCAKASPAERDAGLPEGQRNNHPTVKPLNLMRWLVRLATPLGGCVLDPFMGSGSTGCAAALEQLDFLGIELDPAAHAVARARIAHHDQQAETAV